ncbi:MAG: hypothetical protein CVT92_00555 [Bacteroidetes bacterium HGW-Bacteroidetes-1]|nr:MAG: hypothetical protein CVT92_00555 [Bacteroidetes bacterium HGW-Bacteroidetes-1]
MNPLNKISFSAPIIQSGEMNAGYIEFPFSVKEIFGTKGQVKVKALIDNKVSYRGSLANMGTGCHIMIIVKDIRAKIGKSFGDIVYVELEKDTDERIVEIPDDLLELFAYFPEIKIAFDKMSYTHRKEYINRLNEAKKLETCERRKLKMMDMLLKKG